ncbi:MAG: efflux RND transporter periplasmic adaptor subunit [Candidatus Omnitrophica bacterium]|nr:efflux RND transporter periplasmic adaptor subunit [Candidatus Omnitrophota bacterium]
MGVFRLNFGRKKSAETSKSAAQTVSRKAVNNTPEDGTVRDGDKQTESAMSGRMKDVINNAPKKDKPGYARHFPRFLIWLLIAIVFIAAIFFITARAGKSGLSVAGLIDKVRQILPFSKKAPEGLLITPEEEAVEELVTVRTYRVVRGDFTDMLSGMGTIRGDREIELRFESSGIVESMNFFEGDMVRRGDIVATLAQKDALLKLEYAKEKLKTQELAEEGVKKKVEIHQRLFDDGIIIKSKLEEIQLEYETAHAQSQMAKKEIEFALSELDKTYRYSPIDGVMGTRDIDIGEYVTPSIKIGSLYDTSVVIAEMGIIEKDINRIALGQKAKVVVDTYPGVEFEGIIENIAPIVEGKSRTLTAKVRIKNTNPKGTLLPGMFARIWVFVYEKKNAIKLPSACLYDLDNNNEFDSVYVVSSDNIAKAVPVSIGYVSTDYVEIVDGLREGEQVVSESMSELSDNAKVDVIEIQEPML